MNIIRLGSILAFSIGLGACFVWSDVKAPEEEQEVIITNVVPDRPPAETSSEDDDGVMHFAGYDVKMVQPRDTWKEYGLNLDGVETYGPDDPHPCLPTREGAAPAPDGVDGIDNQYGNAISPLLSIALPTAICELTGSHYMGKGTYVAGIENWNGEANDAQVTAWIIPAIGAIPRNEGEGEPSPENVEFVRNEEYPGDGGGFDILHEGAPAPPPCFDGNDYFYLNSDPSVMAPEDAETGERRPWVYDENAYIVDNLIVARVPSDHPFTLMSLYRSLPALINDGYIVGQLSPDYQRITQAVLAGRFFADDIIAVAGEIGTCTQATLSALETGLKNNADLMLNPEMDHQGFVCDSISVGIPFQAVRTQIATLLGPEWPPDDRCALEEEWSAEGQSEPRLFSCLTAASEYSFADQWDEEKNPGMMAHCENGTLIPGVLD